MRQRDIELSILGPATLWVRADPLLLGQALLNLLLNAAEAMEQGGRVHIEYGCPPEGMEGRPFYVVLEDTGPGIPPQIMDRIFNPFFTTKDTGTGLGLAIVHRVVEAHDGSIVVTNLQDKGARFEIRI